MEKIKQLRKIALNPRAHKLLHQLLDENPQLTKILSESKDKKEATKKVQDMALSVLKTSDVAMAYYKHEAKGRQYFHQLRWEDFAAIRILDYINNAGKTYKDPNLRGDTVITDPIRMLYLAYHNGIGGAKPDFFIDMIHLFRQLHGKDSYETYSNNKVKEWMNRWPDGLQPEIIELRKKNKDRIINIFIDRMDTGDIRDKKYKFTDGMSHEEKYNKILEWWNESVFHLRFAIRSPELLNQMLDYSLDNETLDLLERAKKAGIPFFVNPYYLSLVNVNVPEFAVGADLAIMEYILYSNELVNEFGHIVAWEKEDIVEVGKPNAAGWILPSKYSVHRRYPEVAILIPETIGRACGGLCSSCQRMYDFQRGNLNFDLDKLRPNETWHERLERYMQYWKDDSQLRDILITGGDALMSTDKSLARILDAVYQMAKHKREANKKRKKGEKYAELLRVRLGTRLPIYLPQRITDNLTTILRDFKEKASAIGVKQFVIQTHVESPMEITPESKACFEKLISAGWTVTNQLVFIKSASRRGHTAKLRKVMNDVGVLPYYTFTVKGYMENASQFATNARAVQEQIEEKRIGAIPEKYDDRIKSFPDDAENMKAHIDNLRTKANLPFLGSDRNVLNLPGVGKSLTFRVIGITRYGRRILEFDHDSTRNHSPIIHKLGKVPIIESKSIQKYLEQMKDMGEDIEDYNNIFGYSIGETEHRIPIYDYPEYDFEITKEISNLET
ncbi:MAG: KamA family protein [Candidatus Delongbacteria bacterium]|jgi:lysine 2,3-aminomutase|nr:KamA family protein [Candidatus Delongbacteria bacterium]